MRRRGFWAAAALAALLLVTGRSGPAAAADAAADRVFTLIHQRLALMQPVAAFKWIEKRPVEDLAREAVVLDKATEQAVNAGLAPDGARAFFQAQILAAKDIQNCWIARWHTGAATPPDSAPDLASEVRPKLIAIGNDLLAAIGAALAQQATFGPALEGAFQQQVALDCLSPQSAAAVYRALGELTLAQ